MTCCCSLVSGQWSACPGQSANCLFICTRPSVWPLTIAHREHCPISCSVSDGRPYDTVVRSAFHRQVTRLMSQCYSAFGYSARDLPHGGSSPYDRRLNLQQQQQQFKFSNNSLTTLFIAQYNLTIILLVNCKKTFRFRMFLAINFLYLYSFEPLFRI